MAQRTGSHPNSAVNPHWARLVLGWGTTREPRVPTAGALTGGSMINQPPSALVLCANGPGFEQFMDGWINNHKQVPVAQRIRRETTNLKIAGSSPGITLDFESNDPGSSPGRTCALLV